MIAVESGILLSKVRKLGELPIPSGQRVLGTISFVSQGEVAQLRYMTSLERRLASLTKKDSTLLHAIIIMPCGRIRVFLRDSLFEQTKCYRHNAEAVCSAFHPSEDEHRCRWVLAHGISFRRRAFLRHGINAFLARCRSFCTEHSTCQRNLLEVYRFSLNCPLPTTASSCCNGSACKRPLCF